MFRIIMKTLAGIVILVVGIVVLYIAYMSIKDYNPDPIITLNINSKNENVMKKDQELSALIFNIGYCGLDANQDFFMDGGDLSRSSSEEQTMTNLVNIINFIEETNSDFIMLQEVDKNSTRSFFVDQYEYITNQLKDYSNSYALNYKVPWVPVPLKKPHGKVESGIAVLSEYKIDDAKRYQFPGKESWPKRLAMLDRCMIVSRCPIEGVDNELVLLNIHLSAYDKGGSIRKQQLGLLKEFISNEYSNGNYVIVGGDWNHFLPGVDGKTFDNVREWPTWLQRMPEDFKPDGFEFYIDKEVPTNRTVDTPYIKGENYRSIIDGYLVSDNIEILSVDGCDLDFENSDHQPVKLNFKLK